MTARTNQCLQESPGLETGAIELGQELTALVCLNPTEILWQNRPTPIKQLSVDKQQQPPISCSWLGVDKTINPQPFVLMFDLGTLVVVQPASRLDATLVAVNSDVRPSPKLQSQKRGYLACKKLNSKWSFFSTAAVERYLFPGAVVWELLSGNPFLEDIPIPDDGWSVLPSTHLTNQRLCDHSINLHRVQVPTALATVALVVGRHRWGGCPRFDERPSLKAQAPNWL